MSFRVTCCFDTFDSHLLCLCSFRVSCKSFDPQYSMSWNASASSNVQEWTPVRAWRQDRQANRPTMRRKSEWICNRRSSLLHELPTLSEVLRCTSLVLDMMTGKGQPVAQAKGNEPAGSEAAQPKKPSQLEQARTTLQSAKSAGLPQGVITSPEQEVGKASCAECRGPPDRSSDRCCESKVGKSFEVKRSTEGTLAMLEEHVKANQQEKTAAQATLQELTSKATMELERGGEYNHLETAPEQILGLIGTTWPAGEAAPRVNEMVHQARSVFERSRSRSKEHSKKRDTNAQVVTGDRYQSENMEHGVTDDFDISIDFGEPDSSPAEDPTECFAKMQRLAKEDDVTIARAMRA